jgi:hypothetical protein
VFSTSECQSTQGVRDREVAGLEGTETGPKGTEPGPTERQPICVRVIAKGQPVFASSPRQSLLPVVRLLSDSSTH